MSPILYNPYSMRVFTAMWESLFLLKKEWAMSGQIPVVLSVGGLGAIILPNTSASRPLFYIAVTLLGIGLVAMVASIAVARKAQKSEAK